ncbi:putative bifunctional diguanylate cyclase/phosphodiesterase [Solicola sp. PLA-1-18]|uniref:putative bifunctional diguanylate cyclase/phosphodiesterase n=1 Tax=Solicola sp. PLA-1-18 TaxID=3380532 RepID=UPI003B8028E4
MTRRSWSRVLEGVLVVIALVTVVFVGVGVVEDGVAGLSPWWLVAIVLIVAMSATPLYLDRYDSWLVIGLEAVVLVFASLALQPHLALLVWCVGVLASQLVPWRSRYKIFNASVTITAGAVAVLVVDALRGPDPDDLLRTVAAVVVAFAAYYAVDVVTSVVSIDLESEASASSPDRGRVRESITLFMVFMGVNSVGVLAYVVERSTSPGYLALFAAPLVIIVLAVRSLTRERETARRLSVLFDIARAVHTARTQEQVVAEIARGVATFGKNGIAGLRAEPPGVREVGRPLICDERVMWLVLDENRGPKASTLTNTEALSNIVQQGEEALSRVRMTRELTFNAQHDALTSLTNRSVFLREVEHALVRVGRRPGRCAVLFCDLDGFKKINDQFGHEAGDAVLVEVARRLRTTLPPDMVLARLGGDEFAALVDGSSDIGAERIAQTLRSAVGRPIDFDGTDVVISVSVGVAYSNGTHTADQLVRNADIAMYDAKRSGRDRLVEYHPLMGTARVRALEMVDHLRRAIDTRELSVVYQPVISAGDGRLVGVEALTRWKLEGETIPPDVFIPIAEEANLIQPLGELVLDTVAADLPVLDRSLAPAVSIAVNISALQLSTDSFVEAVFAMQHRLDTHPLILEITETEAMSDEVIASAVMEEMIDHGVAFHVDDFGVGFSSLGYLMKLPVQGFKLDRLFSGSIDRDERNAELLASVIAMGEALGLQMVVEGIERATQIDVIRQRVDPASFRRLSWQGYLLGKPMEALDLGAWASRREDGRASVVGG